MRAVVALLFVALAFAGCSDDGKKEDEVPVEAPAAEELGLEATEKTGVIVGVVVDRALTPLKGVTVNVQVTGNVSSGTLTTTTEANGAFGFDGLPAGLYVVEASKLGWNTTTVPIEVEAGVADPEAVRVFLDRDARLVPSIQLRHDLFYVTGGQVGPLLTRVPAVTGNASYYIIWDLDPGLSALQGELSWEATTPAAESVFFYCGVLNEGDSDWTAVTSVESLSPATVLVEVPEGKSVNQAQCLMWPDSTTGTVGASVEQKYDLYASFFHYVKPNAGWTFIADGPHPPPEP